MAEHEENIFKRVATNEDRLEDIEKFIAGDKWTNPGLLSLLATIQARQAKHAWQITLLLFLAIIQLVGFLVLLGILLSRIQFGP